MKVIRIQNLPTGADSTPTLPKPYKIPPPAEYTPEDQPSLREDLKPLQFVQPEGVSFRISEEYAGGAVVEWQKWRMRIGFNHREGMVLYNVTYDGRSLFWRVALSDMNIPYADPRSPYHKKSAFDLGDAVGSHRVQIMDRHSIADNSTGSRNYGQQPQTGVRLSRLDSLPFSYAVERQWGADANAERDLCP